MPFATRDTLTPVYAEQLGARAGILALLGNIHLLLRAGHRPVQLGVLSATWAGKTAVLGIVLQVISTFGIPFTSNIYVIYLWQALAGFSFGMAFAAFMSLSVVNTSSDEQSTRMGLFQTIYSCGMFVGPVMMGVMMQHINLSSGYILIAALSVVAAIATPLSARWVYARKSQTSAQLLKTVRTLPRRINNPF